MVKSLTNLIALNISSAPAISGETLKELTSLKSLIAASNELVFDDHISHLTNLTMLNIFGSSEITNVGLHNLINLEELYFGENPNRLLTRKGTSHLSNLSLRSRKFLRAREK